MTSRELCSIYVSAGTGFEIDAYTGKRKIDK